MKILNRKNTLDRRWNTNHLKEKYKVSEEVIANHVADFDYPTPEFIFSKIVDRCSYKSLSYAMIDNNYYDSIIYWYKNMKGIILEKEWINSSYGVLFSMAAILNTKSNLEDSILINTPCYSPFVKVCQLNNRKPVLNKLILKDNKYFFDFDSIENQIKKNNIKIYLLCNPLNPTGRTWTIEELNKISNICLKYGVLLVSDEVHSDLIKLKDGFNTILNVEEKYSNNVIVVSSATKAFNIGGMSSSYMISKNTELLKDIWAFQEKNWLSNANIFAIEIMKAAYSPKGIEWVEQMQSHHKNIYQLIKEYLLENELPLHLLQLDAGYCCSIVIKDDISKLSFYKEIFIKNNLLVRFNDDFYDYENLWFRLIISTSTEEIQKILNTIKRIFKKGE